MQTRILVVDDEDAQREVISDVLTRARYEVAQAAGVTEAIEQVEKNRLDLIITDLKMDDGTGMDVLKEAKRLSPETEVIVMTAYGSIESAVEAMRHGAHDYVTKPFGKDELLVSVQKAIEHKRLRQENLELRELVETRFTVANIVGAGPKMQKLFRLVEKSIPVNSTILIQGESGTGKELVARSIHFNGPRKKKPFIAVNCAAVPENLIESELFGHEKGAFTGAIQMKKGKFELADGGTIFLDEIGDMSLDLQAKLLRVLQEMKIERVGGTELMPVDVRVIAATNKNLEQEVAKGNFREDLFFRLNVIVIEVPPLRERREDIPQLIDHFKKKLSEKFQRKYPTIDSAVVDRLVAYYWPGNVRELENTLERLLVLTDKDKIELSDLPQNLLAPRTIAQQADGLRLPEQGIAIEDVEKQFICEALSRTGGHILKASKLLGMTYKTLQYRIRKYEIKV
ncbi:MAG: sigma-54-dependent Fis family transcriptional regulator [Candidatus Abyssobacteria bacterium SURF_17]|uniref:Sigma-54-dependent Fis family transcriptional regulator n=1 Tax=Candidatus Abyssobacteria bacterium SURF_17 TaxID=2093361 RepID=A0A419ESY7_9BACT|nr:MAG: sigma-54-dependent Fis family transcriptional regulator [Candidatus Abyssubacteria bacterium SURF_17]